MVVGTGEGDVAREGRQKKLCSDPGPWARFHQQGLPLPLPHSPWALGYPLTLPAKPRLDPFLKGKEGLRLQEPSPVQQEPSPVQRLWLLFSPSPRRGKSPLTHTPPHNALFQSAFSALGAGDTPLSIVASSHPLVSPPKQRRPRHVQRFPPLTIAPCPPR